MTHRRHLLVRACAEVTKVKRRRGSSEGGSAESETRPKKEAAIRQTVCGSQVLALSWFSAAQTGPPSPTPTPTPTQMVLIEGLHDRAAATHQILRSDSLRSLNTPD